MLFFLIIVPQHEDIHYNYSFSYEIVVGHYDDKDQLMSLTLLSKRF